MMPTDASSIWISPKANRVNNDKIVINGIVNVTG